MKIKLKENEFEAIMVTGHENQFAALKRFCGEDIKISYESCAIDDYWLIQIYDSLKDKWEAVPNFDYILKFQDGGFTVLDNLMYENYFEKIEEIKNDGTL